MKYRIDRIEGIGAAYAAELAKVGITNTGQLLENCGAAAGRRRMARESGCTEAQLLKWSNIADLIRISGIGEEYSELPEAAGVDTVKELKQRNADNLAKQMAETNAKKKLTRQTPGPSRVARWIDQAKSMRPMVSH